VAGHVADCEGNLAVLQRDDVEPVAAHLRGAAGGLVAVRDLQPRHLRDVPGQQAALQGDGRGVLAGVQAGVIDAHRRPRGQVAGQPRIGLTEGLGVFGPAERGHPQGDPPGDQWHRHGRVHALGEKGFRMSGRAGDLPTYLVPVPRQEGLPPQERRGGRACDRRGDQIARFVAGLGPGSAGVAHRHSAQPQGA
jgi:hypothetical protein